MTLEDHAALVGKIDLLTTIIGTVNEQIDTIAKREAAATPVGGSYQNDALTAAKDRLVASASAMSTRLESLQKRLQAG